MKLVYNISVTNFDGEYATVIINKVKYYIRLINNKFKEVMVVPEAVLIYSVNNKVNNFHKDKFFKSRHVHKRIKEELKLYKLDYE